MTVVPFNGNNYNVPSTTEENWSGTYGVDGLLLALATKSVNPQGGLFSLQNDLDFGPTAGTASVYYKSRASDIAQGGVFRFGHADTINWRNAANTADLPFGVDSLNRATFNGTLLLASAGVVTASRALSSDGSGNIVSSSVTSTELGYVSGVTSALQAQLNTITGNVSTNTTNIATNTSNLSAHTGASTGVHGVTGAVVGTTDTQTLTNKILAAASNTISGLSGSNFASQSAGTFLAGPASGSSAAPTFRALQGPTIQKFTSGSGTYTTPAGVLYLKVRVVGGGGGGAGSGVGGNGGTGGNGAASTFGTSLLTANGGSGGTGGSQVPGAGGSASIGAGATGLALTGATGQGAVYQNTTSMQVAGVGGGASAFGGVGNGGAYGSAGGAAQANTGSGGGSAGCAALANMYTGNGGGAGGFVDAVITSPTSTYSYSVGTSGGGGTAGTSGFVGGAGAAGVIIVEEHYQ